MVHRRILLTAITLAAFAFRVVGIAGLGELEYGIVRTTEPRALAELEIGT